MSLAKLFVLVAVFCLSFGLCYTEQYEIERDERSVGDWGEWSPWSSYGLCTSKCGPGYTYRSRRRRCIEPPCVGSEIDIDLNTCYSDECPGDLKHSSLAQWSPCLPNCGAGIKIRAKGTLNRQLIWEARQCKEACPEKRRRKRWFSSHAGGSISTNTDSSGSTTTSVKVNTPAGSFSGSVNTNSRGKVTGGSVGYSKNVGIAHVGGSAAYDKDKGVSAGVEGGVDVGGVTVTGGGSYNFKDKSVKVSGSASAGGHSVGASYNKESGASINVGHSVPGKRLADTASEIEELCRMKNNGLFKHPGNCRMYVYCERGVAFIRECIDGKAWNDEVKRCEPIEEVGCVN